MMKRGSPLTRYAALVSRTPPARGAWKRKRSRPAVPPATRTALEQRSAGLCEIGLDGCWHWADDPHHRITTKAGGRHGEAKVRHDALADLLHACRHCHDLVTSSVRPMRTEYLHAGLILLEHDDPTQHPVTSPALLATYGAAVWLHDDGSVTVLDSSPVGEDA